MCLLCFSLDLSCMGFSVFPQLECFLSLIWEAFGYNLFKYFLWPFLSFPSGTPMMQMLVHLLLPNRSVRLSSILLIHFSLFFSVAVIYTTLSSISLIPSSASVILLLNPPSVFFISHIVLFKIIYSLNLLFVKYFW